MDTFKTFILDNVPVAYGQNTKYETPVLVAAVTSVLAVFYLIAHLVASYQRRRMDAIVTFDKEHTIYSDVQGRRRFVAPLPGDLVELRNKQREKRNKLSIFTSPIIVIRNFIIVLYDTLLWFAYEITVHPLFKYVVLPIVWLWGCGTLTPGPHQVYCNLLRKIVELIIWWVGLGVLSSVGLGTGMHSGLLFLFPHIMRVAITSNLCGNTNFDSLSDMWFRDTTDAYTCISPSSNTDELTILSIFLKVIIPAMLWGSGTALGEIPPYAISRAARLAGDHNADMDDITSTEDDNTLMGWMKHSMIKFVQNYGFLGVVLFSAYPNAMFDLCGIVCGHFLMPFWTFFGATLIGKAGIKVNGQALLMCIIFSPKHLTLLLNNLKDYLPLSLYTKIESGIHLFLTNISAVGTESTSATANVVPETGFTFMGLLKEAWGYIMLGIIGWFVLSCIIQFAIGKQEEIDDNELAQLLIKRGTSSIRRPIRRALPIASPYVDVKNNFSPRRVPGGGTSTSHYLNTSGINNNLSTPTHGTSQSRQAAVSEFLLAPDSDSESSTSSMPSATVTATAAASSARSSSSKPQQRKNSTPVIQPDRAMMRLSRTPVANKSFLDSEESGEEEEEEEEESDHHNDDDDEDIDDIKASSNQAIKQRRGTPARVQSRKQQSTTAAIPPSSTVSPIGPEQTKTATARRKSLAQRQNELIDKASSSDKDTTSKTSSRRSTAATSTTAVTGRSKSPSRKIAASSTITPPAPTSGRVTRSSSSKYAASSTGTDDILAGITVPSQQPTTSAMQRRKSLHRRE